VDDDIAELAKRIGMDPGDFEGNDVAAMAKRFGLRSDQSAAWNIQRVLAAGTSRPDPWEGHSGFPDGPFDVPIPVVLAGELDLDPLEFALELTRPAISSEVAALTDWIAGIGREESSDEDDHVSSWSDAEAGTLADSAAPVIAWHFDAALAGPATIRRLIERTAHHAVDAGLPAQRLLVGHVARR
jgi:hypothetical protein